ncbi:MAG: patatin-like phospholipase family protein [Anaerolineales bacterium]|nr:patatin-like phospholipase family protein [Anaerolineales bacterium]
MKSNGYIPRPRGRGIALVLGGGGLRGGAHVGVLRVLERENIPVRALAGSSIGGLIAAAYAAGTSPHDIQRRLSAIEFRRLLREPSQADNALLGLDGVESTLREVLGDKHFQDLDIPLALTALDVGRGYEVVLTRGSVLDAVMATIAIPGIFPSRQLNGWELVDGGLSNPVPVQVARELAPGLPVVAVPLGPPLEPQGQTAEVSHNDIASLPIPSPVKRFRMGRAFMAFTEAITMSGRIQGELRLAAEKPELIIRPPVADVGVLGTPDVGDLVARGEAAAQAALPALRRLLQPAPLRVVRNWLRREQA